MEYNQQLKYTKTPAGTVAKVRPHSEVRARRLTGHPQESEVYFNCGGITHNTVYENSIKINAL